MKRMSVAEQTLKKQIDRLQAEELKLAEQSRLLHERRDELLKQRCAIEDELTLQESLRRRKSVNETSSSKK